MVKDFDSDKFSTDHMFMTNADVPTLAFKGIINNPINPFTKKPINDDAKQSDLFITASNNHKVDQNDGNTYLTTNIDNGEPAPWYRLNGDPLTRDSWTYIGTDLK